MRWRKDGPASWPSRRSIVSAGPATHVSPSPRHSTPPRQYMSAVEGVVPSGKSARKAMASLSTREETLPGERRSDMPAALRIERPN